MAYEEYFQRYRSLVDKRKVHQLRMLARNRKKASSPCPFCKTSTNGVSKTTKIRVLLQSSSSSREFSGFREDLPGGSREKTPPLPRCPPESDCTVNFSPAAMFSCR
mmetsp:Transcript_35157/g.71113  ORF Transcript_35157/g.71113 Transcript_35157/m.71113 type:complete len:106 (+) Transcript_35157:441-758(+)